MTRFTGPEHFHRAAAIIDQITCPETSEHVVPDATIADATALAIVALTHAQLAHTEALLQAHGKSWALMPS